METLLEQTTDITKFIIVSLILKIVPDKTAIEYILQHYFKRNEKLEFILSYWSSTIALYLLEENPVFELSHQILKPYYDIVKTQESLVRTYRDKGNRFYRMTMTDYFCCLTQFVFNQKFDFKGGNKQQLGLLTQIKTFYQPTDDSIYNSWLDIQSNYFYNFVEEHFIINFSREELKTFLK